MFSKQERPEMDSFEKDFCCEGKIFQYSFLNTGNSVDQAFTNNE